MSIVSGLNCKIVVQFEKHSDFYNALKVLCGRSLQKVGPWCFVKFCQNYLPYSIYNNESLRVNTSLLLICHRAFES